MDPEMFNQNPFSVVTFIAAPALLTNASSLLVLSTINRMLRTRDRMEHLFEKSEKGGLSEEESIQLVKQVDRVEIQAALLLQALHGIYIALGAFAGATLVTLIGAGLQSIQGLFGFHLFAVIGLLLGCLGVGGLIFGSVQLFHATQISLVSIRDEAAVIRRHQALRQKN